MEHDDFYRLFTFKDHQIFIYGSESVWGGETEAQPSALNGWHIVFEKVRKWVFVQRSGIGIGSSKIELMKKQFHICLYFPIFPGSLKVLSPPPEVDPHVSELENQWAHSFTYCDWIIPFK